MLSRHLRLSITSFVFLINFNGLHAMPKDLRDLVNRWDNVPKKENFLEVASGPVKAEIFEDFNISKYLAEELDKIDEEKKNRISDIAFKRLQGDVRAHLIKHVLPPEKESSEFCRLIVMKPFKAKESDNMTADELLDAQKRSHKAQCRKTTSDVLGGIFHTNPETYLLKLSLDGPTKTTEIVFYVQSIVDSSQYLRYHFVI